MLHLTNGSSAGQTIEQTDLGGAVVPWNDILHEGPVPAGLTLPELSAVRARFIADAGWAPHADVVADFAGRDAALAGFGAHEEVVLWFEHDLYDQLQLLQILDWLAQQERGATRISLIVIDRFPGIERFVGLGQLTAEQLRSLWDGRQPVTADTLALAQTAWAAFRAPEPTHLERVIGGDTAALPLLAAALRRHLEQFPAVGSGLARTERTIMELIAAGVDTPVELFLADQAREASPFLGDTTFWSYIARLGEGAAPLVATHAGGRFALPAAAPDEAAFREQRLGLTAQGQAVLAGRADRIGGEGIDRWLGGVHLTGATAAWRWDAGAAQIVAQR